MLYSMKYDETFNMKYDIKNVFEVVDSLSCLVKLIPEADIVEICFVVFQRVMFL